MLRAASRYAVRAAVALAGPLEQVGAHRLDPVVTGERRIALGRRELLQAGLRSADHGDRDDPVQRDHRPRRERLEQLVEREDLQPVGVLRARRLVVHRGDRGLQLIGAEDGRRDRSW